MALIPSSIFALPTFTTLTEAIKPTVRPEPVLQNVNNNVARAYQNLIPQRAKVHTKNRGTFGSFGGACTFNIKAILDSSYGHLLDLEEVLPVEFNTRYLLADSVLVRNAEHLTKCLAFVILNLVANEAVAPEKVELVPRALFKHDSLGRIITASYGLFSSVSRALDLQSFDFSMIVLLATIKDLVEELEYRGISDYLKEYRMLKNYLSILEEAPTNKVYDSFREFYFIRQRSIISDAHSGTLQTTLKPRSILSDAISSIHEAYPTRLLVSRWREISFYSRRMQPVLTKLHPRGAYYRLTFDSRNDLTGSPMSSQVHVFKPTTLPKWLSLPDGEEHDHLPF